MNDRLSLGTGDPIGIDMSHDIVPYLSLAAVGDLVINIIDMSLKLLCLCIGYIESELLLALGKGDPKTPPSREFLIVREYFLHLPARIAAAERIFVYIVHSLSLKITRRGEAVPPL